MAHEFKLGDKVKLAFGFADRTGDGIYEIVRLLPLSLDDQRQYRVRGQDGFERAIGETQIRKRADLESIFKS